jgi:hypothetical protein
MKSGSTVRHEWNGRTEFTKERLPAYTYEASQRLRQGKIKINARAAMASPEEEKTHNVLNDKK